MGTKTAIAWTDHTFNPWIGCTKVSAGCTHCYAQQLVEGRMGLKRWGNSPRVRTKGPWRDVLRWNREAERDGVRRRVFCASLADVFEDAPGLDAIRAELWPLIDACFALDWQLLTKRPENIRRMLPAAWLESPRAHVWLGTSVEDQRAADVRVPHLLAVPAAVRFLSCEPLLGPVDLDVPRCETHGRGELTEDGEACNECLAEGWSGELAHGWWLGSADQGIDWVIVGGESGPGARPCDVGWIRSVVDQCGAAGVACFVKQLGAYAVLDPRYDRSLPGWTRKLGHAKGGDPDEWPEDLRVRAFPEPRDGGDR